MDYIKYETTLKASGREYSKIVFWNRRHLSLPDQSMPEFPLCKAFHHQGYHMQSEHTVFQFSPMKVHLYHKTIHLLECRLGKFHIHLYFWFPV